MKFPRISIQPEETSKIPLLLLGAYLLIIRQVLFYYWPDVRPWDLWILTSLVGIFLLFKKKTVPFRIFSGAQSGPHLLFGLLIGTPVLLSPILMDWFIESTPLAKEQLFLGAETRALEQPSPTMGLFLEKSFLYPFLGQILIVGMVMRTFAARISKVSFIFLTACLFPLVFWHFNLGMILLGGISAWMFLFTGTLYAGFVFQAMSGLAGLLVVYVAPRTVTLFGVIF